MAWACQGTQLTACLSRRKKAGHNGGMIMADSVYKVVDLVGTSTDSWEKAAAAALKTAAKSLRDLRVAEVQKFDIHVDDGKLVYRVKMSVSFKYEK